MSKKDSSATVRATTTDNKWKLVTAVISGIFVVVAATITSGWWFNSSKSFKVTVRNRATQAPIEYAEIKLESEGKPTRSMFTDTNGVVLFPAEGLKKEIRIWVEAKGFEKMNMQAISSDGGIEISLNSAGNDNHITPLTTSPTLEPGPTGRSTNQKETPLKVRDKAKPEGTVPIFREPTPTRKQNQDQNK